MCSSMVRSRAATGQNAAIGQIVGSGGIPGGSIELAAAEHLIMILERAFDI